MGMPPSPNSGISGLSRRASRMAPRWTATCFQPTAR
jgi:hypothetical protein